jgi:hypothetical protein
MFAKMPAGDKAIGGALGKEIAGVVREYCRKQTEPLEKCIKELEDNSMRYAGIYSRANQYRRGDVTTNAGGLWFCIRDSVGSTSGDANSDWQLITKSAGNGPQPSAGAVKVHELQGRR